MALTNFTVASIGLGTPVLPDTTTAPLHIALDDLLYSPEEQQADYAPKYTGNEPFSPPSKLSQPRRSKVRKRAGTAYLPPPNQYTQYPRQDNIPFNPFNSQLHTQIYQQNSRLDVHLENQRIQEINTQYDNGGQYVHDPTGDYDYEQKMKNKNGLQRPLHNPGYADSPYPPATSPNPTSSRRFENNPNQNFNNYNYNPVTPPSLTPRNQNEGSPKVTSNSGNDGSVPLDRPRGFTKVETNSSGGKTQLHAILDYDDDYYEDDHGTDAVQPAITPLQGPIFLRNGSVPVVPLTSYPTVNNGSFYQIPILWTALSLALGYELQGQIIRGVPCVKRNFQLYCPTAGNTYPLDKIETFIDENKALIKRMYGSFTTPGGNRVRRAPGVPDMEAGDSYFRHVRQAKPTLPDTQSVNSTGRCSYYPGAMSLSASNWVTHRRTEDCRKITNNVFRQIDACESKTEIMTPYWALNSARKLRAIVNTMHFEQAIHQEVCSKQSTSRCSGDCGCEQKYKWHRLLAYDPNDDCAGIFMDWFLFPSCCVCRCKP